MEVLLKEFLYLSCQQNNTDTLPIMYCWQINGENDNNLSGAILTVARTLYCYETL